MSVITQHAVGTFCWPELMTTDLAAAKKFYSGLFGWTPNDAPMPDGNAYTMIELGGQTIGGMYSSHKEEIPPHWNLYIAVNDADEAAKRAASVGGTVILAPFDVMDAGRMAVIQDPTGATFSVWQPKAHAGSARLDEIGTLSWNELMTRDTEKASAFYSALFGWRPNAWQGPIPYTVFQLADEERMVGGMMEMPPEMKDAPPHWLPYFQVADTDAVVARARELGGTICNPPMDIPNVGRIAMIADPQGAAFAIAKFTER